jgi:hypothetical protein
MSGFLQLNPRPKIKVPAQPGDVVLLTPGALSDPNGRIHWWKFVMDFGRPDGTRGTSNWLVASHKYAARHNFDPETFQIIGDVTWEAEFTSPDGGINADVFLGFMQGERERPNPVGPVAAVNTYAALRNRAKTYGLTDRDLELLGDIARPFGQRRMPFPGASSAYDRRYAKLLQAGLTHLKSPAPGVVIDHFLLTDDGKRLLTGEGHGRRRLRSPYVRPRKLGSSALTNR